MVLKNLYAPSYSLINQCYDQLYYARLKRVGKCIYCKDLGTRSASSSILGAEVPALGPLLQ